MYKRSVLLFLLISLFFFNGNGQDSSAISWQAHAEKTGSSEFHIVFNAEVKPGWHLYAPNQDLSGTPSMELIFQDSSFSLKLPFIAEGKSDKQAIALFNNASFFLYTTKAKFSIPLLIKGTIPARIFGSLNYFYGKEDSFYSGNYSFNTGLVGGVETASRIRIN